MAAGQYSAGTIFLQVVPVFRDTMDRIQDESKKLSKAIGADLEDAGREGGQKASKAYSEEMEKGAKDAGEKAGTKYAGAFETSIKKSISSAQKEIDRLDFSTASENSIKDLDRVKRKLAELKDVDFSVDFDAKKVLADIAIVEASVKKMASGDHEINITANAQKVLADLRRIAKAADDVEKQRRELRFEGKADFKPLERQVGAFEKKFRNTMRSAASSLGDQLGPEVKRIRSELEALSDVEIGIDIQAEEALTKAAILKAQLQALVETGDVDLDVELDAGAAIAQLAAFDQKVDQIERHAGAFEKKFSKHMRDAANSLGDGLGPEIAKIKARLESLADAEIGVDLDATEAMAQAQGLKTALEFLQRGDVDVDVDVDLGAAIAQIALLNNRLDATQRNATKTAATVGIMGAVMAAFTPRANAAGSAGENAANSFRSFNFVILAAVTLLPALVPVLAAVGGGLLALIPILGALGAGLGVAILGFSGIGGALTEMGNVADEQATASDKAEKSARSIANATHAVADAERSLADARRNAAQAAADAERAVADARRNAARAAEDAAERVADAREQAAETIKDALKRQKDAQEEYRDAVQDVADAEQALRDARAEAEKDAADLGTRQRQNAVDERQGVVDLFEAQAEYNAVMSDGSSTNLDKEVASINLEQAQIALNDVRAEQVALSEEAADYAKNGVDGSEKVKSAQEQLAEAMEAQKDAIDAVKEAAKEADEARSDGAEMVADALRDQKRVMADSARAIDDALRNQRRTAASNARSIADAQRALARAQEGQAQAVTEAAEEGSAAMDRLEVAMDKLSPAGRKFARFLFGLRGGFREIRDEVQERMLPGIQRGMQAIIDEYGPKFKAFAGDVGESLGTIGENTGKGLGTKPWQDFFRTYGRVIPRLIESFAESSGNWMTAWAGLFTTIAPYAERLAEGLLDMSERAERFFNSAKGRKEVREFMEYAFEVGPKVVEFFKDLVVFAKDLAKAMAPIGELVLTALGGFMDWISSMDPKTLQLIVTMVLGLAVAFQLAVGAIALIMAGGAVFASLAGTWIFLFVAIGAAVVALYQRFPIFRKIIDKALEVVGKAFDWLRDIVVDKVVPAIRRAIETVWKAIQRLWEIAKPYLQFLMEFWVDVFKAAWWVIKTFVLPILSALWDGVMFLWNNVVKPYLGLLGKFWGAIFLGAWKVIKHVILPVLDLLGKGIIYLYRNYVKPYFKAMKEAWEDFTDAVDSAWKTYVKPVFDAVANYIKDEVEPKFRTAVETIAAIWDSLKAAFLAPIKFMVNAVLNEGLIEGFNWVARKVGSKEIDRIEWAEPDVNSKATGGMLPWGNQSRAVGGVLPGYNPGRDNFTFYNPQLGQLNLSGGEGILRPEVVKAAGGEPWLNSLNHAAMRGGVQGVQKQLFGSFASGGKIVFPVRGGYVNRTDYNLGHDGMDINHPNDASGRVPFVSATSGQVTSTGYSRGYGNAVFVRSPYGELVYGHAYDGSLRVAPGQKVSPGQWLANIGNTGNSQGAHLHFGFPGGTFYGAEALLKGSSIPDINPMSVGDPKGISMPKWAKRILSDPMAWMKGLISKPLDKMREKFGKTDLTRLVTDVPKELARRSVKFVKNLIPGPGAAWDKIIGNGVDPGDTPVAPPPESGLPPGAGGGSTGGVSAWRGGILPYNGTMKYDAGGYLPPGLTSVVNLTGKPEPVFTADQFADIEIGGGKGGITYAPTFSGTRLTAADVTDDIDFTFRRLSRSGRYGRTP